MPVKYSTTQRAHFIVVTDCTFSTVRTVLEGNPRLLAKGYVNCSETQFSYRGTLAHSIMYKNYS